MSDTTLQDQIRNARSLASSLQSGISKFSSLVEYSLAPISSEVEGLKSTFNPYVNIESVPGARTPKWYLVEIEFESGETQSKSRAIEISSEGAFVMKSMMSAYLVLDDELSHYAEGVRRPGSYPPNYVFPIGIRLPTSTYSIFANGTVQNVIANAPTSPITTSTSEDLLGLNALYEYPEFSVGFELESKGIQLTERPIPAAFIYSVDSPLYISSKCYVDRSERLIVTARPDARVPLKGKFQLVMHGYQVLGDIDPKPLRRLR